MSKACKVMMLLMMLVTASLVNAQQIAFPGAEGAGKYISGGRGTATTMTTVFEVTNLTDVNSPGSLRYACSQSTSTYPYRTIVFRVAGTIHLNSKLNIPANTTLAGQTAPGDGICLADYPVVINGNNVIVRYMRFRMGDKNQLKTSPANCGVPVAPFTAACMPLDGSGGDDAFGNLGNKNLIIDHCSVSWSSDEALTVYRGDSVTMQWNLISEPLNYSYHFETGDTDFEHHGYGGIWGSLHGSFHHNLIAHCRNRTPRFAGNSTYPTGSIESADFRNNVIYNWGINNIYGGEGGQYNIVNNYFKYGPSTSSGVRYRVVGVDSNATSGYARYYLAGNYIDGSSANTANNWLGAGMNTGALADTVKSKVTTPFLSGYQLTTTEPALAAYDSVLKYAGCVIPVRDTLDQRIINNVKNRTGQFIDVQGNYPHGTPYAQTVNAWPTLNSAAAPTDTDHDGMPDDWEIANSLNPNNASDRGLFASNGYTNLENYLNNIRATTTTTVPTFPATATWTLQTNQSASVVGNITASNQSLGSGLAGIQYGSTFGGVGSWQRVGTTSFLPVGYDANVYTEYKVAPTGGKYFTASLFEMAALGGGTGTARMAVYYSLDNFATAMPIGSCTYNGTGYDATINGTPVVLLNTSTSSLTGQQIASFPIFISVAPAQTLTIRVYAWITGSGQRYFTSQNVKVEGITTDASLPVTFTYFTGTIKNNNAELVWGTANESNMLSYELQKSKDGVEFTKVVTLPALNRTSNQYSYNDKLPAGTVYYRIKAIDKDGSFIYSKVLAVSNKSTAMLSVFPNPTTATLLIKHPAAQDKDACRIIDMEGRMLQTVRLQPQSSSSVINVQALKPGAYIVEFQTAFNRYLTMFYKN